MYRTEAFPFKIACMLTWHLTIVLSAESRNDDSLFLIENEVDFCFSCKSKISVKWQVKITDTGKGTDISHNQCIMWLTSLLRMVVSLPYIYV